MTEAILQHPPVARFTIEITEDSVNKVSPAGSVLLCESFVNAVETSSI